MTSFRKYLDLSIFVAPTYVEIVDIDRSIPATANNRRMKQFISFESKHGFVHQTRLLMIGYRWIINIQFWGSQVEWLICKQLWSQADIDARRSKVCELQFFVRIPHKISIEIPDFGLTFNHEIAWFLRYADRGSSASSYSRLSQKMACDVGFCDGFLFPLNFLARFWNTASSLCSRSGHLILNTLLGLRFIDQTDATSIFKSMQKIAGTTIPPYLLHFPSPWWFDSNNINGTLQTSPYSNSWSIHYYHKH